MDERLLCTAKEASSLTGISEPQIRLMISRGDLPHLRIHPRGPRLQVNALRAWITDRTVMPHRASWEGIDTASVVAEVSHA